MTIYCKSVQRDLELTTILSPNSTLSWRNYRIRNKFPSMLRLQRSIEGVNKNAIWIQQHSLIHVAIMKLHRTITNSKYSKTYQGSRAYSSILDNPEITNVQLAHNANACVLDLAPQKYGANLAKYGGAIFQLRLKFSVNLVLHVVVLLRRNIRQWQRWTLPPVQTTGQKPTLNSEWVHRESSTSARPRVPDPGLGWDLGLPRGGGRWAKLKKWLFARGSHIRLLFAWFFAK